MHIHCTYTHAAYPVLNKTISSTKLASVPLGGEITVPCAYLRGAFEERYDVTWYQGVHQVDTSVMQYNRYEVRRDFSLVIRDMKPGDASNAYYCQVRVNVTNDIMIVRRAPFISVDVLGKVLFMTRYKSNNSSVAISEYYGLR